MLRALKFKLDRKSLETLYISFIRPLLEYGDTLFDKCTKQDKQELDTIQVEAARIVTATTKLVSHERLYKETVWDSSIKSTFNMLDANLCAVKNSLDSIFSIIWVIHFWIPTYLHESSLYFSVSWCTLRKSTSTYNVKYFS